MSVMAELDVSRLDLLSWEFLILKVSQGRKTREIQEPEIWTQKTRSVKRHLRVTSHLLETSRRIILLGVTYTMFQDVCDQINPFPPLPSSSRNKYNVQPCSGCTGKHRSVRSGDIIEQIET